MVYHGRIIGVPMSDRRAARGDLIEPVATDVPPTHDPDRTPHDVPLATHDRRLSPPIEPDPVGRRRRRARPIDWPALFGNDHPVELEVGSGKGLFLANAARANPGHNFLGVELARKYARLAAERLAKQASGERQGLARRRPRLFLARHVPPVEPPRGPCLLPRPLVEEAAQEAPGLRRAARRRHRADARSRAASCTSPPTSRSTSA